MFYSVQVSLSGDVQTFIVLSEMKSMTTDLFEVYLYFWWHWFQSQSVSTFYAGKAMELCESPVLGSSIWLLDYLAFNFNCLLCIYNHLIPSSKCFFTTIFLYFVGVSSFMSFLLLLCLWKWQWDLFYKECWLLRNMYRSCISAGLTLSDTSVKIHDWRSFATKITHSNCKQCVALMVFDPFLWCIHDSTLGCAFYTSLPSYFLQIFKYMALLYLSF